MRSAKAGKPSRALAGVDSADIVAKPSSAAAAATMVSATFGPTPGMSRATRKPATRSRGFSAKRMSATASLTCAASRNFKPPYLTNGTLRRVSSSSSAALWWEARNSTAWLLSAAPVSRLASTRVATKRAWSASSATATSTGRRTVRPIGAKGLGEALRRERDDRVGGGKDGAARTIVALERHHMRRRIERAGKIEDVAHRRRAEGIDRLRIVADHGQAASLGP